MNDDLLNFCGEVPQFALKDENVFEPDPVTGSMKFVSKEDMNERLSILNIQVENIFRLGRRVSRTFVEIGNLLVKISLGNTISHVCRKSEDYPDIFVFANKVFGFSRSTTYGLMSVAKRFGSSLHNVGLKPDFQADGQKSRPRQRRTGACKNNQIWIQAISLSRRARMKGPTPLKSSLF